MGLKEQNSDQWLRLGEWEYDISEFVKSHPGGRIITYYTSNNNEDATDAFLSFHRNLPRAHCRLAALPRRRVTAETVGVPAANGSAVDVEAEFRAWRDDLERRGFFKPDYTHVVLRCVEPVIFYTAGCIILFKWSGFVGLAAGVLLFAIANVRCSWLQHEAGHCSVTCNPKWDKSVIQRVALAVGLSGTAWRWNRQHNRHHAATQKAGYDVDLETLPFVAFYYNAQQAARLSWAARAWLRWQAWTFLPVVCGGLLWAYWAVLHIGWAAQRDRPGLLLIVLAHVLKPAAFMMLGGVSTWWHAVLLYLAAQSITGLMLFGQFSLSHTTMPVLDAKEHKSWVRHALDHTVDISPGHTGVDWVMGYLNYQVVHHLFPSMPQFRGAAVSRELAALCRDRWGIQYHVVGYWEAWRAMLRNLDTVGKQHSKLA